MRNKLIKTILASAISLAVSPINAETYIRVNQLGYTPDREKVVQVMSHIAQQKAVYQVTKDGQVLFSRKVSSS